MCSAPYTVVIQSSDHQFLNDGGNKCPNTCQAVWCGVVQSSVIREISKGTAYSPQVKGSNAATSWRRGLRLASHNNTYDNGRGRQGQSIDWDKTGTRQ